MAKKQYKGTADSGAVKLFIKIPGEVIGFTVNTGLEALRAVDRNVSDDIGIDHGIKMSSKFIELTKDSTEFVFVSTVKELDALAKAFK